MVLFWEYKSRKNINTSQLLSPNRLNGKVTKENNHFDSSMLVITIRFCTFAQIFKMAMSANDYGIQEMLQQLGIKEINNGACTGTQWFNTTGEVSESY